MRPARMVVGVASRTAGPRSRARSRAGRVAVAAFAFGAVLLVATPARAGCPLLDVDCLTEAASGAADDVVDEATQVVDEAAESVDEVVAGVADATEPVTTTVVTVVESVVTAVDETVDDVVAVVEQTVEGAVGGSPEEPRPGTDDDTTEERSEADPRPGSVVAAGADAPGSDPGTVTPHAPTGPDGVGPLVGATATLSGGASTSGSAPTLAASPAGTPTDVDAAAADRRGASPPAVRDAGPSALAEAARTLAFPLALAILIALFLLAQHRVDRRAPKLALAPVEPDLVGFRRAAGR
jgi:hypothetical protein